MCNTHKNPWGQCLESEFSQCVPADNEHFPFSPRYRSCYIVTLGTLAVQRFDHIILSRPVGLVPKSF